MEDTEITDSYSPPGFSSEGFIEGDPYNAPQATEGQENIEEGGEDQSLKDSKRLRKKRVSSDRRFDQLVYERGMLQQENLYKDSLIAEQNRKLEEFQSRLQDKDKISNDYFETALQERSSTILKDIRRAKEEGDIDTEIKLIEELADLKAKKNTNSLFQFQRQEQEIEQQHRYNEAPYVPLETPISPQQAPLPEEFQDWLEDNPWYNNSPRLRQEADIIAQDLSDRLAFNNQSHLIGTPEFFNSVSNLMNSHYGLQNSSSPSYEEQEAPPSYSSPINTVAPVSRKGNSMADQYVQNRPSYNNGGAVRALTKEEFSIARHLPIRQRGEGESDLIKRYAQAKNYPKSPLEGGTPHRLTII